MRAILVDWLSEVHLKFKLLPETFFISVNIMDRFLEREKVERSKLQLVGITALMIAAKYEEIYPPELRDYAYIADNAYTKSQILQMEFKILSLLQFGFTFPTPYRFLERYIKLIGEDPSLLPQACFFAELAYLDVGLLRYPPSLIAGAGLYLALRFKVNGDQAFEKELSEQLSLNDTELKACAKEIYSLFQSSRGSQLQAMRKKYQASLARSQLKQ